MAQELPTESRQARLSQRPQRGNQPPLASDPPHASQPAPSPTPGPASSPAPQPASAAGPAPSPAPQPAPGLAPSPGTRRGDNRYLLVTAWALGGLSFTFLKAIVRLGARALETIGGGLATAEWAVLVLLTLAFVYGEGVRGIQQRFAPNVVTRLHELIGARRRLWDLLGPFYLLSLVGAPRRTLLRAWLGVSAIALAVITVRAFPEPWRGITDFAVVAALAWGLVAILVAALQSLRGHRPDRRAAT
jgi:hypothetical protein